MSVCKYVGMYAGMHACRDAWMHACMDAWMHACMHGWMDGCMEGWIYRYIGIQISRFLYIYT